MHGKLMVLAITLVVPQVLFSQGADSVHGPPGTVVTRVPGGYMMTRAPDPNVPRDGLGITVETRHYGATNTSAGTSQYPIIYAVQDSSPAKRAGLLPGDVILSANGIDVSQKPVSFKPPQGTQMTLRIKRGDSIQEVTLTSARLYTPPGQRNADTASAKPR